MTSASQLDTVAGRFLTKPATNVPESSNDRKIGSIYFGAGFSRLRIRKRKRLPAS